MGRVLRDRGGASGIGAQLFRTQPRKTIRNNISGARKAMRHPRLVVLVAMAVTLTSSCQTTPRVVATTQFDAYAGCWVHDAGATEDRFCITEGTNNVVVTWRDREDNVTCQGSGTISAMPASGFLVDQPRVYRGCDDGGWFVAQELECYPTGDSALSCENRFGGRVFELLFNRQTDDIG